ncbi:hypothetical protein Hanom_Chr16g01447991 [Helianthus anomalus]
MLHFIPNQSSCNLHNLMLIEHVVKKNNGSRNQRLLFVPKSIHLNYTHTN